MNFHTKDFRLNLVKHYLTNKQADPELSVPRFQKEHYPQIKIGTVYNWISSLKSTVGQELAMSENEIQNKYGVAANEMTLEQKYSMVKETVLLPDEEKGEYCRKHQIYLSDLEAWGKECDDFFMRAIRENAPRSSESKPHKNGSDKELRRKVSQLEAENKSLKKAVYSKDKALATYAAKVITLKNFHQLFVEPKEG